MNFRPRPRCLFYILDASFTFWVYILYVGCLFCNRILLLYFIFSYILYETLILLANSCKSVEPLVFSWHTLVNPANACIFLANSCKPSKLLYFLGKLLYYFLSWSLFKAGRRTTASGREAPGYILICIISCFFVFFVCFFLLKCW